MENNTQVSNKLLNIIWKIWKFLVWPILIVFIFGKIFDFSNLINSDALFKIIFLVIVGVLVIFFWFSIFTFNYFSSKGNYSQFTDFQAKLLGNWRKAREGWSIYLIYLIFGIATMGVIVNIISLAK
jgi:hypothetical protein